jgi:hypothetical protein
MLRAQEKQLITRFGPGIPGVMRNRGPHVVERAARRRLNRDDRA